MPGGRNLFKRGTHFSRLGGHASFNPEAHKLLRDVVKKHLGGAINRVDYGTLLVAIAEVRIARGDESRGSERATRDDSISQLKAMDRAKCDNTLMQLLRDCAQRTFNAINQAGVELVAEVISERGVFVDTAGNEYTLFVPEMVLYPDSRMYLPMGIPGLRQAIARALTSVEKTRGNAGRKRKPQQDELAEVCRWLWWKYRPEASQRAWNSPNDERCSGLVEFSQAIFNEANAWVGTQLVVKLLKQKKKKTPD